MWSFIDDDAEDDELLDYLQEEPGVVHGGSEAGKAPNKRREFTAAAERFDRLYFGVDPIFNDKDFRRRFQMSKRLYWKITEDVKSKDEYIKTCKVLQSSEVPVRMQCISFPSS